MRSYSPEIEARRLKFTLPSNVTKYWHSNSSVKTYHFNALAIFLPILENLVVLSLKKARNDISCPILQAQVNSLVAQEAIHGSEFAKYNTRMISPFYPIHSNQYKIRIFRILAGIINQFSQSFHYALSAAGEHFTAISADLFLRDDSWFEGVEPIYSAIWRWHCIEEIEHKTVAFDVYKAKGGGYLMRILAMFMMTLVFSMLYIKPMWTMMKQDGNHKKWEFYKKAFQYYWGKNGLCRVLFTSYIDYYKPSFHPKQHQNEALITRWKAYFSKAKLTDIATALALKEPPLS